MTITEEDINVTTISDGKDTPTKGSNGHLLNSYSGTDETSFVNQNGSNGHHLNSYSGTDETSSDERNGYRAIKNGDIEASKNDAAGKEPYDNLDEPNPNCCIAAIGRAQGTLDAFYKTHGTLIWRVIGAILLLGYAAYFGYAMYHRFGDEGSVRLLAMTGFAVFCVAYSLIKTHLGDHIYNGCIEPVVGFLVKHWKYLKWVGVFLIVGGFTAYIIADIAIKYSTNLISLSGMVVFILLLFIFSHNPARVRWRPVFFGLTLQMVFALLILRTSAGCETFKWLGSRVSEFLAHTDAGSRFVFGDSFEDHRFAFKILPVVIFFSCFISVLYYLGVMQLVIGKVAWVMQATMGTTAAESVNAAGNIFVGMTEAPLLIRPLINDMTKSELHAVMTGGFATIAGSVLASFILFGVPANHLLSASVMAAPAALATSKLFYPETEESKTTATNVQVMEKSDHTNIIEAASSGASSAISLVANIGANLIAFLAMLAFINATLTWFGARVGLEPPNYPALTFQFIMSYLLWPAAFLMGVRWQDCRTVAQLIGVKTFLNEFVAYTDLGVIINNRRALQNYTMIYNETGIEQRSNGDIFLGNTNTTLVGGVIEERSEVISTYALCGFANIGAIGIMLGGLGSMAPNRKGELSKMAVRAMIAGMTANFLTASIAGLLYQGSVSKC
ncbi:unnamed protein product [Owenia fusiformis]|uniref:Sodium/nucleoside cotransporter n=1 Tax=Owenia fusiformis TaxID=6347 RepID=A0A8S4PA23_OWEFU|nr:unnamed protein product [Owenia fusiformis]